MTDDWTHIRPRSDGPGQTIMCMSCTLRGHVLHAVVCAFSMYEHFRAHADMAGGFLMPCNAQLAKLKMGLSSTGSGFVLGYNNPSVTVNHSAFLATDTVAKVSRGCLDVTRRPQKWRHAV